MTGRSIDPTLGTEPHRWRIPAQYPVFEAVLAVILVIVAVFADDATRRGVALVAALVAAGWAGRDVLLRVRLEADADGVRVARGLLGRESLRWADIESVGIDERSHRGIRSRLLEIDAGDRLVLLSARDLGVDPHDALVTLQGIRSGDGATEESGNGAGGDGRTDQHQRGNEHDGNAGNLNR